MTIDVAKGIAQSGNSLRMEKASITAIAIAPPTAPANTERNWVRSNIWSKLCTLRIRSRYVWPNSERARPLMLAPSPIFFAGFLPPNGHAGSAGGFYQAQMCYEYSGPQLE